LELQVSIINKDDRSLREVRCTLEDRLVVGRGPESTLPVDGPAISREHLFIEANGDGVVVTDVSANGCWINGARIPKSRRTPVREFDLVEVPGFEIRIRAVDAPPAASALPPPDAESPAAAPVPVPAGVGRYLAPAQRLAESFTRDEKYTAVVSLVSLALIAAYAFS
jgi:predicted component of type VI protein secretion system